MNKILAFTSLFFTVVLLTNPSQAAETKKSHQKADFLKTVDKNGDGKASKQEFIAAMEKKFHSMDVDKSEAVSVQELKLYGEKDEEARKKALQAAKLSPQFEKIISKKNILKLFTARAEREFTALDKNHDNELSADEAGAKKTKKKKNAKAKKTQLEKKLSKADFVAVFTESAEQNFTKLDKNRDGKLTDSELGIKTTAKNKPALKAKSKAKTKPALLTLPKLSSFIPSAPKPKTVDKKAEQQKLIKSLFVGIDANKDGQVSNKEKNTVFERLFNRLDTNHDKVISQDEIIAGRHQDKQ